MASGRVPPPSRDAAGEAAVGRVLLQHDVDDAAQPVGLVARRRVRDDLDALDGVGADLLEVGREELAADGHGPPVDVDRHVPAAAQGDVVVLVHLDGGQRLERFEHVVARRDRLVADVVDRAVGALLDELALGLDAHAFEHLGRLFEADLAEVGGRAGADGGRAVLRGVAHDADAHVVVAGAEGGEVEAPLGVGRAARDERRVGELVEGDGGEGERVAGGGVEHAAGEAAAARAGLGERGRGDEAEEDEERDETHRVGGEQGRAGASGGCR